MKKQQPQAMAFYHENGLIPSWQQAGKFAGPSGRVATLPDIITARLTTKPGDIPWGKYFTTSSSEYFWKSKGGNRILIVAHGNGPMGTLKGATKAYSHSYKDKEGRKEGGRISEKEFYDLESGKYGDVTVVDFEELAKQYQYLFCNTSLRASEALIDPLMKARLGKDAEKYIEHHAKFAKEWQKEKGYKKAIDDPFILGMDGASIYGYNDYKNNWQFVTNFQNMEMPAAHLLMIRQLVNCGHEGYNSLSSDIGCHDWTDGTRMIGVREGTMTNIHNGPNAYQLMREHWKQLMQKTFEPKTYPLYALMKLNSNTWFTQKHKTGAGCDNGEPQFHVKKLQKCGRPVDFITKIGGYHGFFKYDIKEVEAINSFDCNVYSIVGDIKTLWHGGNPEYHKTKVQFYKADIDTSQQLIKEKELANDYDKLIQLMEN